MSYLALSVQLNSYMLWVYGQFEYCILSDRSQILTSVGSRDERVTSNPYPQSQKTQDIDPMLYNCWSTVNDAGPTVDQNWIDVLSPR